MSLLPLTKKILNQIINNKKLQIKKMKKITTQVKELDTTLNEFITLKNIENEWTRKA